LRQYSFVRSVMQVRYPSVCAQDFSSPCRILSDAPSRPSASVTCAPKSARLISMTSNETHRNASHISGCLAAMPKVRQHKTVLVHCQAGISRSSAIALILATSRHIKAGQSPDRAVALGVSQIRAAMPHARPNMRVIELGADAQQLRATNFIDLAWELHRSSI
tara:strand:+ start:223 stop:711 length:489 start_codon:yes stop_codon:yes gene_type:complete